MAAPTKPKAQVSIDRIFRAWNVSEADDCEGSPPAPGLIGAHDDRSEDRLNERKRVGDPVLYSLCVEIGSQVIELRFRSARPDAWSG